MARMRRRQRTWLRRGLAVLSFAYLANVWLDAAGVRVAGRLLPRPIAYFAQIACLFPHAATEQIEFRAAGYLCADRRFAELDVRPFFPIHKDDKESRFDRALFFYRRHRPTLLALEDYLVRKQNQSGGQRIGGVEIMSLRIPLPEPGQAFERYQRRPLDSYPASYRKYWYTTPPAQRSARCEEAH
jgi:hypothetical protein